MRGIAGFSYVEIRGFLNRTKTQFRVWCARRAKNSTMQTLVLSIALLATLAFIVREIRTFPKSS